MVCVSQPIRKLGNAQLMPTRLGLLLGELVADGELFVGGGLPVVCAELVGIKIDEISLVTFARDDINTHKMLRQCSTARILSYIVRWWFVFINQLENYATHSGSLRA
jgi:hypothetical protein